MYKAIIKPVFFLFNPEKAHQILVFLLSLPFFRLLLQLLFNYQHPSLEQDFAGLRFRNPVGMAAGFDKEAEMIDGFEAIGFGFIEIGTITPIGQAGNPRPRLFRIPQDQALINRMGFNNKGLESAINNLKKRKKRDILVGGNIGKNKITPLEKATDDYMQSFEALFPYVDYFVVNVSSPNTPNLRKLQDKGPLTEILSKLSILNSQKANPKPVLLKIAPDLSNSQLDDIIDIVHNTKLAGIVATNTTISREGLTVDQKSIDNLGPGGLSGKPLTNRATEVIKYIHKKSGAKIPIMGVGGIHSPEDAIEKFNAGASMIQIYTGMIYEGPGIVKRINKALVKQRTNQ